MPEPPDPELRILIVDGSDAFLGSAVAWIAGRPGLQVVGTARTGSEGLDAVERLDPDLVLVDAVLPGLDGFQLVREIKKRERPPFAVVTTFMASSAAKSAALDAGADGFVAKDDFAGAFDLLLGDIPGRRRPRRQRITDRERSVPRGSRTEPIP